MSFDPVVRWLKCLAHSQTGPRDHFMALNGVGIVSADKAATLRIFTEGLGLSFQHRVEGEQGQHSEAEAAGVKLMVDTVDVIKRSNPDYQFPALISIFCRMFFFVFHAALLLMYSCFLCIFCLVFH